MRTSYLSKYNGIISLNRRNFEELLILFVNPRSVRKKWIQFGRLASFTLQMIRKYLTDAISEVIFIGKLGVFLSWSYIEIFNWILYLQKILLFFCTTLENFQVFLCNFVDQSKKETFTNFWWNFIFLKHC